MSLRPGWEPPKVHFNVISGRGGLGDSIARIPAFKYVLDTYSHIDLTVYVQDGWLEVIRYLQPPGPRLEYKKLSEASWELKKPIVEFDPDRITTLHMHLTDHAFGIFDLQAPNEASKYYPKAPFYIGAGLNYILKDAGLATKSYIVFTTDYTAPVRQWPACHINALGKMCREAGLIPVLIGTSQPIVTGIPNDDIHPFVNDGLNKDIFIDLRDKTNLIEALGVIQRAKAVVGVDNGLLHLAHCTDTPIVIGFTSLKPEHRVPSREHGQTKILESLVPCAGCQSRGLAINKDWRTCIFDDYACTLTLTSARFWGKLKELNIV